ncbi:dihydrofolate reductase family protein [Niabella ginsengisoli]|uniref:Dihydrofolate reductase family protein n=1 Tax=Niabella ginsengisoli TaxID=522298 RepID=A0ABS9SEC7_9BACT|nr:dihydrofolate reductase family protein [Niabella ginsengisoli]MCH5596716.1 dihydrofolate reductase family protein [Niabella ginsengisoli]
MREIQLIVHISLDGFVASESGSLDGFQPGEDNLAFVTDIAEQADTILSGRVTYDMLNVYWPTAAKNPAATKAEVRYSNWYNDTNKIIVSRTLKGSNEMVLSEDFISNVKEIKSKPGKPIVIFGSPSVAGQLMEHNLIDVYWIFVNPVIFGKGIPWFKTLNESKKLKITETRKFINGEMGLKYHLTK